MPKSPLPRLTTGSHAQRRRTIKDRQVDAPPARDAEQMLSSRVARNQTRPSRAKGALAEPGDHLARDYRASLLQSVHPPSTETGSPPGTVEDLLEPGAATASKTSVFKGGVLVESTPSRGGNRWTADGFHAVPRERVREAYQTHGRDAPTVKGWLVFCPASHVDKGGGVVPYTVFLFSNWVRHCQTKHVSSLLSIHVSADL